MKRVLLTGGGGAGTEALWRYLGSRYDLYFADADPSAIIPVIPEDRRVAIARADSPDFLASVRGVCERHRIDVIVPGVDEELLPLSRRHGAEGWPEILVPPADFVELMLDKLSCARAIAAAGLAAPRTERLAERGDMSFPMIVKPNSGRGSRGVMKIDRAAQIAAYLELFSASPDDIIAQDFATGQEYTVFMAADAGRTLRAVVPVRVGVKRGITIRAVTDRNAAVIDYAQRFHDIFRPYGIYNIQCIHTEDGRILPFEVNPRVSTTFCLAVATGYDPFSPPRDGMYVPEAEMTLQRNWLNTITVAS